MSDVWVARINRYVEKLFNVKGGPTVLDIDPAIRIDIPLKVGVEDASTQGWNRFAVSGGFASGAAQLGAVMLRNPPASNVIAVLERFSMIEALSNVQTRMDLGYLSSGIVLDLPTLFTQNQYARLDGRINTGSTLIASLSTNATVLTPRILAFWSATIPLGINSINMEIPLLPGSAVQLTSQTVNQTLIGDFMWRERALETSELT